MKIIAGMTGEAFWLAACATAPASYPEAKLHGCQQAIAFSQARRGLSVFVLQQGDVVCSSGGQSVETPYELWSGTKSFVGILAAAAVQDGLLELDELAADTLTEWAADPLRSRVTLRQILWMVEGQPSEIGNPPGLRIAPLDRNFLKSNGPVFLEGDQPPEN